MSDELHEPQAKRRYATPKLLGAAVAFLGGAVVIAWYLYTLELVTVPSAWVPMQYNTAVGFVLTGVAVVAHCVGRRRVAFLGGALAAGIGSVALAEQLLGRQLALVDWLFDGPGDAATPRMAPATALCFALAGCLIVAGTLPTRSQRWKEMTIGVLAALLAAAGFVGLMGYVLDGPGQGRLARFTQMELHTGLGFVALGVAFFAMVDHFRDSSVERRLPAWASWAAGLGVGVLILTVWVGLTSSEERLRAMALTRTHANALAQANQLIDGRMGDLTRLARVFGHSIAGTEAELATDVDAYLDDLPGVTGLLYVDARGRPAFSRGQGAAWPQQTLLRADVQRLLRRTGSERDLSVSEPLAGEPRLWVALPVDRAGVPAGALLLEHDLEALFGALFARGIGRTIDVELATADGRVFYRSDASAPMLLRPATHGIGAEHATGHIAFGDQLWTLRAAADPFWITGARSVSNTLILWVGIFLAVAIAFVVRKSELLRQRAAALLAANRIIHSNTDDLRRANESLEEQARNLRATEERLRRAAREKRRVLDSLSAFLVGVDGEGTVIEWNFVSSELFGLRSSETLGRPFEELELPWDRDGVRDAIVECLATGERVRRDAFAVTRRGERDARLVSFTVNPTQEDGRRGFTLIGSDVTERQLLETQLHHAQKLESVGTLAAGIAHEINTPMQFVSDNVRFLSQSLGPMTGVLDEVPGLVRAARENGLPEEVVAPVERRLAALDLEFVSQELPLALEETMEGVERVTTIVRAMKDFSHPGEEGMAPADLNKALETTLAVARNEYKYWADVETDFGALPPVECWVADLNQVFLNLLVNGSHAIRDKVGAESGQRGTIRISTALDGDVVEVRFADTGTGIPEEVREKVFDQFFTTKGVGKGTGLGLAICHAVVVDKHGGSIDFESTVGQGTTFVVRLPVKQLAETSHDARALRR